MVWYKTGSRSEMKTVMQQKQQKQKQIMGFVL